MEFSPLDPPREFTVGAEGAITLKDCGKVRLEPDEIVTFTTENGAEYDVARKDWGFYATPSLNGRLLEFGLRGCLVKSRASGRIVVMLVEEGKQAEFDKYLEDENLEVMTWLCDQ